MPRTKRVADDMTMPVRRTTDGSSAVTRVIRTAIAVLAVTVATAAGCGSDPSGQTVPNPAQGMPGHDYSRLHPLWPHVDNEGSGP
jgi:hypothetical protein